MLREDLVRYVRSIVNEDTVAHDLVQDVFVSLWSLRISLDPARPLKAYLYRMARNRAYRHLRDERTHAEKHAIIEQQSPKVAQNNDHLDAAQLSEKLKKWIGELPARQREALVLSRYHELSHRDVAAVMEVSPRTVNNHIMRALEHLQARIRAFEPIH